MKRLLMFAAATALIATACSEDTTTPSESKTYMPTKTGAYVIHQNYSTSTVSGTVQESDDSTVVVGTQSIADDKGTTKTGIMHVVYTDGAASDTIIVAEDGSKVYVLFDLVLSAENIPTVEVGRRWVLVADSKASASWTGLEETVTGLDFEYGGSTFPADVTFKLVGSKSADTTMSISGKSVSTIKYANDYTITLVVKAGPPFGDISVPIALKSYVYLGENTGLVRQSQDRKDVSISIPPIAFEVPGFNSVAVRAGGN